MFLKTNDNTRVGVKPDWSHGPGPRHLIGVMYWVHDSNTGVKSCTRYTTTFTWSWHMSFMQWSRVSGTWLHLFKTLKSNPSAFHSKFKNFLLPFPSPLSSSAFFLPFFTKYIYSSILHQKSAAPSILDTKNHPPIPHFTKNH